MYDTQPFGKICVHLLLFEVNFIVTWDGSNGFIRALDSSGGDPSDPITIRNGGDKSLSNVTVKNSQIEVLQNELLHR